MSLLEMPPEMLQEVVFQGGACSLFGFILLVRAASTCSALHAAIAAVRHRVVAHFNARLLSPPAYLFGEYGPLGRTWCVGFKDSNGDEHPINRSQKITFEVHAVDDVETTINLRIIVVLKVSIVFAPVLGSGATLKLNLALNFFDSDLGFSLCAALGWPNGTLQAEHVQSEAKQGRLLQALRKDVFDRHLDNQPRTLSVDWDHPLSKLSLRAPALHTSHMEAPKLVEYSASLQKNIRFSVKAMRAVHDFTERGFTGREFDPKPHLWLQLTGLNHLYMYRSITARDLYLDGTPIITNSLLRDEGCLRIKEILDRHLFLNTPPGGTLRVFEHLAFETVGELNDKASGLHLMHTFGYLEHRAAHRAEGRRRHLLEAAAAATLTPLGRRPKRAAAAAAEEEAARQLKLLRGGERQDEDPDGGDLLPAW